MPDRHRPIRLTSGRVLDQWQREREDVLAVGVLCVALGIGELRMAGGIRDEEVEPRRSVRCSLTDHVEKSRCRGRLVRDDQDLRRAFCHWEPRLRGVLPRQGQVGDDDQDRGEEDRARRGGAQTEAAVGAGL